MNRIIVFIALLSSTFVASAQVTQVDLAQAPGVFTTEAISLEVGTYQFNPTWANVEKIV